MTRLNMGVIGLGYWGPNLVRTLLELPQASVQLVADRDQERLDRVGTRFPQINELSLDYRRLFAMPIDAVVVATPPQTHYGIVRECLERGLDVFVEKPLATNSEDARRLVELAEARDRILMVGHISAYNPAVRELKRMIDSRELGDIQYIDAVRVGLGLFHPTLNVIWDLAPHDISLLIHLLGNAPESVSTRGLACVQQYIEDVAYMTLTFPGGILAHTRMSWLDPCKTRRVTVVGRQKMVVYDDLQSHEKLKIYDNAVHTVRPTDTFGDFQFAYHYGNIVSPFIHLDEPLRVECLHFIECVLERKQPVTDGANGLRVVEVIEAAQQSLKSGGVPVEVNGNGQVPKLRRTTVDIDAVLIPKGAPGPASNGHRAANGSRGDNVREIARPRAQTHQQEDGQDGGESESVLDLTEDATDVLPTPKRRAVGATE